ncbi:MAG: hypothetical protein M1281_02820 [Chloroflexi bacterium]|nr:hypothetical protein [Chloroflexota bacterium]
MSIIRPKGGYFPITSVHRNDVASIFGKKVANALTDEMMEILASRMENNYVATLFWEQVREDVPYVFAMRDIPMPEIVKPEEP